MGNRSPEYGTLIEGFIGILIVFWLYDPKTENANFWNRSERNACTAEIFIDHGNFRVSYRTLKFSNFSVFANIVP